MNFLISSKSHIFSELYSWCPGEGRDWVPCPKTWLWPGQVPPARTRKGIPFLQPGQGYPLLPSPEKGPGSRTRGTPASRKDLGPETRFTPVPQERTWDRDQGPVIWGTPSPLLTDTHLWKQYLPHPSHAGGNKVDFDFSHDRNNITNFPDVTLDDAANYCRNPDGEPKLWCYTTDPGTRWQYCNVPLCEGEAFLEHCYCLSLWK